MLEGTSSLPRRRLRVKQQLSQQRLGQFHLLVAPLRRAGAVVQAVYHKLPTYCRGDDQPCRTSRFLFIALLCSNVSKNLQQHKGTIEVDTATFHESFPVQVPGSWQTRTVSRATAGRLLRVVLNYKFCSCIIIISSLFGYLKLSATDTLQSVLTPRSTLEKERAKKQLTRINLYS